MNTICPDINFILNKINKLETFSFIKISIEFWMLVSKAITNINLYKEDINSDKFLNKVASNMVTAWEVQKTGRPWKLSQDSFYRILKFIVNKKPNDILFGISTTGSPKKYPDIISLIEINSFINKTLNEMDIYNASCWKYWAYTGEIHTFFKNINKNKICVIGPSHLKNFNEKINAKNFNYIEISDKEASLHVMKIKNEIINHNKKSKDYTIYIIQGGSPAMDFMIQSHEQLKNACMLDIGRALDIYYYYDPIKNKFPRWYWGGWADYKPPTWLLK